MAPGARLADGVASFGVRHGEWAPDPNPGRVAGSWPAARSGFSAADQSVPTQVPFAVQTSFVVFALPSSHASFVESTTQPYWLGAWPTQR